MTTPSTTRECPACESNVPAHATKVGESNFLCKKHQIELDKWLGKVIETYDEQTGSWEEEFSKKFNGNLRLLSFGVDADRFVDEEVKSFVRQLLLEERKKIVERVEKMNEQNQITQAILGALEYRGFYDAGKYLDGSVWERVKPVVISSLTDKV